MVTRLVGVPYLLDVLARQPRALLVRENPEDVTQILVSVGLRQGEGMFIGPPIVEPSLTPCERRILQFVAFGLSNSQIAKKLGRGLSTINTQVGSILRKMEATSRHEVAKVYWGHESPPLPRQLLTKYP